MFCKPNQCHYKLTAREYIHCTSSYVRLERLSKSHLKSVYAKQYSRRVKVKRAKKPIAPQEVVIDDKVLRINLTRNCLNLRLYANKLRKRGRRMLGNKLTNSLSRSILRAEHADSGASQAQGKSVSFNNTYLVAPISPARSDATARPVKDYESMYKEYLKSVQVNGVCSTPQPAVARQDISPVMNDSDEEDMEMDVLEDEEQPTKRKRGRPKSTAIRPKPTPSIETSPSTPRKRGWPLGVPRKHISKRPSPVVTPPTPVIAVPSTPKGKRGRPRKVPLFSFQTIVSDIKAVALPSELWSAHVSVTTKKSQVCFTRVVQAVSNTVPVECDRSVKFNGGVEYVVRINNRDVELVAAPATVTALKDIEILLEIINDISINDPVLEYLDR